jgi:phosphatidylglycerophosphate synthase
MSTLVKAISSLGLFLIEATFPSRSNLKTIPVKESDYPFRSPRYKAFEERAASLIPTYILPNHLTYFRIVTSVFLILFNNSLSHTCILFLALFAGLSDFFDGAIARSRNLKTRLGILLDPFADKLFVFTILYILVIRDAIRAIYVPWLVAPECHVVIIPVLSYFYQVIKNGNHTPSLDPESRLKPLLLGRIKLHLYVYSILSIISGRILEVSILSTAGNTLLIFGITASSVAFFQYLARWLKNPH